MVQLAGSRYSYAFKAARILPKLREYMSETVGLEFRCARANKLGKAAAIPTTSCNACLLGFLVQ